MAAAHAFLKDYQARHNARFAVAPADDADAHAPDDGNAGQRPPRSPAPAAPAHALARRQVAHAGLARASQIQRGMARAKL